MNNKKYLPMATVNDMYPFYWTNSERGTYHNDYQKVSLYCIILQAFLHAAYIPSVLTNNPASSGFLTPNPVLFCTVCQNILQTHVYSYRTASLNPIKSLCCPYYHVPPLFIRIAYSSIIYPLS